MVFPVFLKPETGSGTNRGSPSGTKQRNMDLAFDRYADSIRSEVEALQQQDKDIKRRATRSEMAYKAKRLQLKRTQLEVNQPASVFVCEHMKLRLLSSRIPTREALFATH